jgi:nicotinate-nucleotide adenylyltransferase
VKVGLLGGSFDPVHFGHLRAAEWARQTYSLDSVRLMPAMRSPFKEPPVASEADRLRMVELATEGNSHLDVERAELDRPAPSYTVDTLRHLTALESGNRFALIVGSDAARGLDKWREIDEIRRMADILILARPGDETLQNAAPFAGLAISASEVRREVHAGRSIRYLTPESVRRYIEEKGLYR